MNELLVLLLPLAAFSGWWLARTDKRSGSEQKEDDYFKGLSYLLEDETDKAIDIFFRIAHLDDSTIENQITLGNLFRHRGEVDRALHIHTLLAEKSELSDDTRQKLNLALAEDYLAAGIMNLAEDHFQKVRVASHPDLREIARRKLIDLYAQQAFWAKAIEVAEELDPLKRDAVQQKVAHFYCELAKNALADGQTDVAKNDLEQALQCDEQCVRATIQQGRLAQSQENYVAAIGYFNHVELQNPGFLPEILNDIEQCYKALNQQHEWKTTLRRWVKAYHNPVLVLRFNQWIAETEGVEAAREFLQQRLQEKPNMLALQAYLKLDNDYQDGDRHLINQSVDKLLSYALKYRCRECGFRGNHLDWQCSGCKNWGTFMPISDVSLKEDIG